MPIHDWTRVTAGTFHAFHLAWIAEIQRALNGGLLPKGYYALAEQVAGQVAPDVLTLQDLGSNGGTPVGGTEPDPRSNGGVAVATAPPRVALHDTVSESMFLATRRRRLVIRHLTGDRIVALLEIVSPGNKERRGMLEAFVDKAVAALDEGYHLLVIDLIAPGAFDPSSIHGAIWGRLGGKYDAPLEKPLTLAAYAAGGRGDAPVTCYVEPTTVGSALIDMPLFLDPGHYVNTPLEQTYLSAYEGVPERWRRVIEGRG
jgi:hypothetical protein